jgi:hypothetical protein
MTHTKQPPLPPLPALTARTKQSKQYQLVKQVALLDWSPGSLAKTASSTSVLVEQACSTGDTGQTGYHHSQTALFDQHSLVKY